MNQTHLEDVDIINELYENIIEYKNNSSKENEENLTKKYQEWTNHTIEHFKAEEIMMEEKKFPPYSVHKSEHKYALNRMNEVFNQWLDTKDISIVKIYIEEELLSWLTNHIQTMDTVTAMFFKSGLSPCSMQH